MNKAKLVIFVVVLTVAVAAAGYKLYNRQQTGITATGTIEVTRADISAKVGGYITNLAIKEGDSVKIGQVMLSVARPDLKAQLLRDEVALTKAEVQLRDLEKGSRSQEINQASAAVASAKAVFQKAQSDLTRYQALYEQGAISAQQMAAAESAYGVADSSLSAANAQLALLVEGNRPDIIEAQRLEAQRSKAIVEASRTQVADTVIVSPLNGLVLTKNFEEGEYVNPGSPIATIGNMNDCWVKIYVASTELGKISVGQQTSVMVDSFPGKVFVGTIKEISQNAEFTPRQSITKQERANLVFAVKVQIDNEDGALKPGMPADVVIK
ncbi:MAG: efflux RND transporter periplasmic adaptor subunit [Pelosinus sp.]|nr:efflux RND transporter periplasmic adaptor subunit [Pelosinus sp.]